MSRFNWCPNERDKDKCQMNRPCLVCGNNEYIYRDVLWHELIESWQLSHEEVEYINRQQGLCCSKCGSNLRSIALAGGILKSFGYEGLLCDFVTSPEASEVKIVEINEAGALGPFLEKMPYHRLVQYPDYDMTKLEIDSDSCDLVLHSDTLEHVKDPILGLSECRRILTNHGRCIFTIPIIVGRLSRSREGLSKSYHGAMETLDAGLIVHTEFGSDFWKYVLEAGFSTSTIYCIEYPSAIAIEARA